MDSSELERLRADIYRKFKSQPHKRKLRLTLLAMYAHLEGTPDDPSLSKRGVAAKRRAKVRRGHLDRRTKPSAARTSARSSSAEKKGVDAAEPLGGGVAKKWFGERDPRRGAAQGRPARESESHSSR
jgi:hypothetical protein